MVASCEKITYDTSPPHMIAKNAYEKYASNATFLEVMDNLGTDKMPKPLVFEISQYGVRKLLPDNKNAFASKSAPRAGYKED